MVILCADVGATKTLLGLAEVEAEAGRQPVRVLHAQRYLAAQQRSLESMLEGFLRQAPPALRDGLSAACFAAAGPVSHEGPAPSLQMTNLPWRLDGAELSQRLGGLPVRLANDFEAAASGIDAIGEADLLPLQQGQRVPCAPQLVIGAGSGLGVAHRWWRDGHYEVLPGEGGHIGFSPQDEVQDRVMQRLRALTGRVVAEHVVSGPGLANVYLCLGDEAPGELASASKVNGLSGEQVCERALERGEARALQAVDLFLRCYGAVAGDHALSGLSRGGVFLAGGIAQKMGPWMQDGRFMAGLRQKGPYAPLMATLPVHVVMAPDLGLLGAALLGSRLAA